MVKAKTATPKRSAIGNKLRFSIYERDNFCCQYCGKNPQDHDIVLNLDHAISVKDGGDESPDNLITSCFECNSGKSAKSVVIKKEERDIEKELQMANDRLSQIKAMIKSRNKLEQTNAELEVLEFRFLDPLKDYSDKDGETVCYNKILKLCKNQKSQGCSIEILKNAFDVISDKFLTQESIDVIDVVKYFGATVRNMKMPKEEQERIRAINSLKWKCVNKFHYFNESMYYALVKDVDIDIIDYCVKASPNWSSFRSILEVEQDLLNN